MKIGIRQKVLMDALNKGSLAAISDDAQEDTSTLSLLIKAIKITVDEKKFAIESSTELMAVKYSVPSTKDDGIVVKENGCILVPAKELIDWVKVQGEDSTINITLNKLQTPEIINTLEDNDSQDAGEKFILKKIGSARLVSKDSQKTSGKWELDCYDPEGHPSVNFAVKTDKNFDIGGKQLGDALSNVSFAALKQDYEHVLDSVSIQTYENNLYFATTDTQRCALYKVPSQDVFDLDLKSPMLIPSVLLEQIAKIIIKDNKLSFAYNEEHEKVFIKQDNLKIRLASTEKKNIKKFPNIEMLLQKQYYKLTTLAKASMNKVLISAAIVNNASALFLFDKEKETLTVKAISEDNKYKPNVSRCESPKTVEDVRVVWGVSHLIEGLKVIKSSEVDLYVPKNLQSLKLVGCDSDNLSYFALAIVNAKYNIENE